MGLPQCERGDPAHPVWGVVEQPFAEANGVPVEDDFVEARSAEGHDDPITEHGHAHAGGGDVIEMRDPVAKPELEGLEAIGKDEESLLGTEAADVVDVGGEAGIDVPDLERGWGGLGVNGEAIEHEFHHVALAVVRRGHMSEHE